MTTILSAIAPSFQRHSFLDDMQDHSENEWPQHYYQQHLPTLSSQWNNQQTSHFRPTADLDFNKPWHSTVDSSSYLAYSGAPSQLINPISAGYAPEPWASDMEMGTPSTTGGYPAESLEAFKDGHSPSLGGLHPPDRPQLGLSPRLHSIPDGGKTSTPERPSVSRSTTAPVSQRLRRSTVTSAPAVKRSNSEESDEEYMPGEEAATTTTTAATTTSSKDARGRGRKRQRIPHTAVERRYRENLNAHLDKLRQAVPALASRRPAGRHDSMNSDIIPEGVKPSKCEILNGAIEYIGQLDRENMSLRADTKTLRARLEELERWYGTSLRSEGLYSERDID